MTTIDTLWASRVASYRARQVAFIAEATQHESCPCRYGECVACREASRVAEAAIDAHNDAVMAHEQAC